MQMLRPGIYVTVVQLPYNNHVIAKECLNKARATKDAKIKIPRSEFAVKQRSVIRGLFTFNIQQMPWYCPADILKVKISKKEVCIQYTSNQQYYKGIEEL